MCAACRVLQCVLSGCVCARVCALRAGWEACLATKDQEVANLTAALGELTFESEVAERLRREARLAQGRVQVRARMCAGAAEQLALGRALVSVRTCVCDCGSGAGAGTRTGVCMCACLCVHKGGDGSCRLGGGEA